MGYIKAYLEGMQTLQKNDWDIIASYFINREFPRGAKLLKLGETENYLSFIDNGIVRYYIPREENDITFNFSFEKEFTCAYDSFLTQSPSLYEQETLAPTSMWSISYDDLQEVYEQTSIGNLWGRLAAEQLFLRKSKREIALLKDSPQDRYLDLLHNKSHIIKHIPLKHIASYIGVTPQALSRIRRRIS
ncbi:Crp/Fnr family transcriptional regulator [Puteibacter caeruleilacunae]|nr:Crp/Fnr family transcriptional regulator [Puteibacter caeruleilacunae]